MSYDLQLFRIHLGTNNMAPLEPNKSKRAFAIKALAAWEEFLATGMHVTSAEADAWLARLEAGENVKPPRAHN
jgi:hypothetical protein